MTTIHGWMMTGVGEPLVEKDWDAPELAEGEVLVKVAGCGVCHTDISFLHMGVPTRMKPPLVLGHEISGTVESAGRGAGDWVGKNVLVPAVLPCGECPACQADRRRICSAQIMPGNDRHGGYASHVAVPAKYLCPVGDDVLASNSLADLAIVSDAVTTPFQAMKRAGVAAGDLAIVIGTGGLGIHAVQIMEAAGAKVIGLDIDESKLETVRANTNAATVNTKDLDFKAMKGAVKGAAKELGAPRFGAKIFEMSGTKSGQETAFGLLGFGATLGIIGFTMAKPELRISNLMAFDAEMFGIWGCDPVLYAEVVEWIGAGKIAVGPYAEQHPLSDINAVMTAAHEGRLSRRAVMVP
ncbi:MAG: 6-hydroxycyclohex-1-ene-1-carbonyl-CoA dehydrogenase [Planctomycetota bacterium]